MNIHAKQFSRDGGDAMRMGHMTFRFKMTADDTAGAYTVLEALVPPDSGSGLHRHWSYDEAAFILGGRFECHVDDEAKIFEAGESIYWPRGAMHKFRSLGPGDGHILFICSPGRIFEDFIESVVRTDVETGTARTGPAIDFREIAAQHGIEFFN
jgi:mannose-6-phosphate isomerase-like protein (cupin superfamily)